MSAIKSAPTLSAIARKRAKSMTREYAEYPQMINFGLCSAPAARSGHSQASRIWDQEHNPQFDKSSAEVDLQSVTEMSAFLDRQTENRVAWI